MERFLQFMIVFQMILWGALCCLGGLAIGLVAVKSPPQDAMFFGIIGLVLLGGGGYLLARGVGVLRKWRSRGS